MFQDWKEFIIMWSIVALKHMRWLIWLSVSTRHCLRPWACARADNDRQLDAVLYHGEGPQTPLDATETGLQRLAMRCVLIVTSLNRIRSVLESHMWLELLLSASNEYFVGGISRLVIDKAASLGASVDKFVHST